MNRYYIDSNTSSPIKQQKKLADVILPDLRLWRLITCDQLRDIKFTGAFVVI
jgi:hypothetical protein